MKEKLICFILSLFLVTLGVTIVNPTVSYLNEGLLFYTYMAPLGETMPPVILPIL